MTVRRVAETPPRSLMPAQSRQRMRAVFCSDRFARASAHRLVGVCAASFSFDVSGPGGLWLISSSGKHLGTIKGPQLPANMAWGDADGLTLYMTARTGLYRLRHAPTAVVVSKEQ